jgi:hypothetical protein
MFNTSAYYIYGLGPEVCKSPIKYLADLVKNYATSSNCSSYAASLSTILTQGIVMPNCDFCCPNCSEGIWMFCNIEKYLGYVEAVIANPCVGSCPVNIASSVDTFLTYNEAVGCVGDIEVFPNYVYASGLTTSISPNKSSFISGVDTILANVTTDISLLDAGFIEKGGFGNSNTSQIITFINYLGCTGSNLENILNVILGVNQKGIVIECKNGYISFSSVETYLTYTEALSAPPPGPTPGP